MYRYLVFGVRVCTAPHILYDRTLQRYPERYGRYAGTHISTPAVGRQDLILLIQVQYLNESETEADVDRLGCVVDRSADSPHPLVVVK